MSSMRVFECVSPPRALFILMKRKQSEKARGRKHLLMKQQLLGPQNGTQLRTCGFWTLREVSIAPLSWLGGLPSGILLFLMLKICGSKLVLEYKNTHMNWNIH